MLGIAVRHHEARPEPRPVRRRASLANNAAALLLPWLVILPIEYRAPAEVLLVMLFPAAG